MLINWDELELVEVLDEILYGLQGVPTHIQETWLAIILAKNDLDMAAINRERVKLIDLSGDVLEYLNENGELVLEDE
jgi:Cdc6-like AAA superfamily ATPase